jgi:hypothetical protein
VGVAVGERGGECWMRGSSVPEECDVHYESMGYCTNILCQRSSKRVWKLESLISIIYILNVSILSRTFSTQLPLLYSILYATCLVAVDGFSRMWEPRTRKL